MSCTCPVLPFEETALGFKCLPHSSQCRPTCDCILGALPTDDPRALCPCQYEQAPDVAAEPHRERQLRAQMRKNVTETLVSLRVNTVDDIQQITAALAQCMVG